MSYQVLARKWRPKLFEALVGQEHVVRALTNALEQQRLHHAYLFTGTRGVGKTTLARILAKSLNCETGITANPCGQCSACVDIDRGRFVDLLEVDAASNTQVDSMRELLENAQYAPTVGRFKVYIIDEVHMLSRSAFNAMLKTLEEPPAHVKFILATTDPQKVPVTVLSRCLQFNLRQMSSTAIADHLQSVLGQENISFESVALQLVARAANGSMRDALSLLDQAIAYGGNAVHEQEVRAMLGAIDQSYLFELLHALIAHDGARLIAQARIMEQRSLSFDAALNDLANLLQQIAITQTVPDSIATDLPERAALLNLAEKLTAEEVQLYYQIALLGRRDLGLAPDEFAGFTMSLLRMLAFTPGNAVQSQAAKPITPNLAIAPKVEGALLKPKVAEPQQTSPAIADKVASPTFQEDVSAPASTENNAISEPPLAIEPTNFDGNWRGLVDLLKLGLARALAQNCELVSFDENNIHLSVSQEQKHLLDANYKDKLHAAIQQYFGRKIQLHFDIGGTGNTPAQQISQEKAALQSHAESAIEQDDFVQALVKDFGAKIIPTSIKPIQ
ncbi:DNA polymerase III, subunit gamma and tau [Methylovorus sp. MM2]|uniref:DNA polymerase III subunit gamma/tau n=1 Tax=Methylovorus sp. MM2 TaxID=1848038 RepID=UPI0007E07C7A|nr:DNA polymerase III subunit gamma/tau [Methylovorus sp. MM2]OAM53084.1 DNA polymerase III, subunit gamma and tau [Methylovorus sp. MM2]